MMITIQLVSGVKFVVKQRISVNAVEIDVNLKELYQKGPKVNISDYSERWQHTWKSVRPST